MSAIVQHKSAVANGSRQSCSFTLDSPVTKGNLIIAISGAEPGVDNPNPISDTQGNSYTYAVQYGPSAVGFYIQWAIAKATGTLNVSQTGTFGDSSSMHLHVFEVSGYNLPDQTAHNLQTGTAASVSATTTQADEFIVAVFACDSGSVTFSFGESVGGSEHTTGSDGTTVASCGYEVTVKGSQSASATASSSGNLTSALISFIQPSNDPADDPTLVYLGQVVVVASVPAGNSPAPYLGHVHVITNPRVGAANPYLGKIVVLGSAPAGPGDPKLGEVTVIANVPAGQDDIFLGTLTEV